MKTTFEVHEFDRRATARIGYARVSRQDQNLAGQLDALKAAGCGRVISERVSSVGSRLGWQKVLDLVRPGDVVCVTRLDRIGRRLAEVVASVQGLVDDGVHVRALQQGVDTSAAGGTIIIALWAALAETERETLRERTKEGLAAASRRGRHAGRPVVLDAAKRELVSHLRGQGYSISEIAKAVKVGSTTVRRALLDAERPEAKQTRLDLPRADPGPSEGIWLGPDPTPSEDIPVTITDVAMPLRKFRTQKRGNELRKPPQPKSKKRK